MELVNFMYGVKGAGAVHLRALRSKALCGTVTVVSKRITYHLERNFCSSHHLTPKKVLPDELVFPYMLALMRVDEVKTIDSAYSEEKKVNVKYM